VNTGTKPRLAPIQNIFSRASAPVAAHSGAPLDSVTPSKSLTISAEQKMSNDEQGMESFGIQAQLILAMMKFKKSAFISEPIIT